MKKVKLSTETNIHERRMEKFLTLAFESSIIFFTFYFILISAFLSLIVLYITFDLIYYNKIEIKILKTSFKFVQPTLISFNSGWNYLFYDNIRFKAAIARVN